MKLLNCIFSVLLISVSVSVYCATSPINELINKANSGVAEAQLNLGVKYALGDGVIQNNKEAEKWTRLAAEQGDAKAQAYLGWMYFKRLDNKEAVYWFRLAAEQGDPLGQSGLGVMFRRGIGVLQDNKEAAKWFRLAAEQGNAAAQSSLGVLYYSGTGVLQDYKEAAKWFRLAAKQGNAEAQYWFGMMNALGNGVLQSYIRAYSWVNLARFNGYDTSELMESLESGMTESDIIEAQSLSKKCLESDYTKCW